MPLAISKECFPTPTKCHNCLRKRSSEVRKTSHPAQEYKRCSGCHIMTYCDQDCQKEHWIRVHKAHCRFLSGKVLADGSQHNSATCTRCIAQNQASSAQLSSQNSPRTVCNVEEVILAMKAGLAAAFGFHGKGKKCSCELEFAFELPFPLWEVSGQYLETASTGLDAMMAHVLNVLTAMAIKAKRPLRDDHKNILTTLWANIVHERVKVWYYILEGGMPLMSENAAEGLSDQVDSLQRFYEISNPWWKTLRFSVYFVMKTNENLNSHFSALHGLEDPKFHTLKLILDYQHSQLQKQAIVSQNKMWSNFMLWPELVNGSLTLLLPPGTRCQNCFSQLSGELTISPDINFKSLVIVDVGDNGALKIQNAGRNASQKMWFSECGVMKRNGRRVLKRMTSSRLRVENATFASSRASPPTGAPPASLSSTAPQSVRRKTWTSTKLSVKNGLRTSPGRFSEMESRRNTGNPSSARNKKSSSSYDGSVPT